MRLPRFTTGNLCPIKMASASPQLRIALRPPRTHGGRRSRAGRKPAGDSAGVTHHGRNEVEGPLPVHATLRVLGHVWNLRSRRALDIVEAVLVSGRAAWRGFRVVHFALQGDHLHFIVEADETRALSEGMQGLTVRLAKGLNRLMGKRGKVFADRYHAHALRTPTEVRNALAYVLLNHRSHMARIGNGSAGRSPDPFSSAATFDGWREAEPVARTVTSAPETWLLREGWKKKSGRLSLTSVPGSVP